MSLRRTAFLWLVALMTGIGLVSMVVSYLFVLSETADLLDDQLRRLAIYVGDVEPSSTAPPLTATDENDPDDDFVVQVWRDPDRLVRISDPAIPIPRQTRTGFGKAEVAGETWRVYTLRDQDRTVQVSQLMTVRKEFAGNAALQAAAPIALLIPLSWLILNWIVARIIGRLDRLATAVGARDPTDGTPIPLDDVPAEIVPFVASINALLARLRLVLERQRQFVSDAAHELRTPLAALQIQIGNLGPASDASLRSRLSELDAGVRRASGLVAQLLRLARYDANEPPVGRTAIDLAALTLDCIGQVAPLAQSREIDIGLVRRDAAIALGSATDFTVTIVNLLDNAIRYTPIGGTVDVSVVQSGAEILIEVADTGPGIPADKLPLVFDRFFRSAPADVEGSGLGLAIARAAAERNNAQLTVANREPGPGLVARLIVPAAPLIPG